MRLRTLCTATLLSAAVAVSGFASPAFAQTKPIDTSTKIRITIVPLDAGIGSAHAILSATLTCDPAGGDHPYARESCLELAQASGDVAAVKPQPNAACLAVWIPVEISAVGTWRGLPVSFTDVESNVGCARLSHGHIFDIV